MYKVLLWHPDFDGNAEYASEPSRTLYSDVIDDEDRTLLAATGSESVTEIPSFEFTIVPSHPLYGYIKKFKSLVTVYCDDEILFYGRIISDTVDFYGQKQVTCEGALSFLLDTIQSPFKEKSSTPSAIFSELISAHNTEIDGSGLSNREPFKRFTVGNITVDKRNASKKFKLESYTQTRSAIDNLLINDYKGFLRARYENSTLYVDWLKRFNRTNAQPVKMEVNLLDRAIEENADEYFTVLLPIGANNKTIESVNNGSKYLEDSAGIAKYGRIVKSEHYSDKKKPADILTKAQEEFEKRGTNLPISVSVKAVDMRLLEGDTTRILLGDQLTNVEDRTGELFTDLTVAEHSYDVFNAANDEFKLENQEAMDKRFSSSSGNGTLSSRAAKVDNGLDENTRNLTKTYENINLTAEENYTLTAKAIKEISQQHNIVTKSLIVQADEIANDTFTTTINKITVPDFHPNRNYEAGSFIISPEDGKTYRFNSDYETGSGWANADVTLYSDIGKEIYIKQITGASVQQDSSGTTSWVQDVSGIRLKKVANPDIPAFNTETAYTVGTLVRHANKVWKFTSAHAAGAWNDSEAEDVTDANSVYQEQYRYDATGKNILYDVISGEAVYDTLDDAQNAQRQTSPIRSLARQTQDEFYQVVGSRDTSSVVINGETIKTMTSVTGSTLWQNETAIGNIVGEVTVEEVVTEADDGSVTRTKNVVINNGSGLYINNGDTYVGVIKNNQLDAGLMVATMNSVQSADILPASSQFSASATYAVGDYVTYSGKAYICTAAHSGAWDSSHFKESTQKVAKIKADRVDLGDYATVGYLQANYITANTISSTYATVDLLEAEYATAKTVEALQGNFNTLVSGNSYAGNIMVNGFLSGENVYAIKQLSIGNGINGGSGVLYYRGREYYRQGLVLGSGSPLIAEGHFLGESSETLNLNHYHDIDIEEVTTGTNAGRMKVTLGAAVATTDTTDHIAFFKIADTATYKAGIGIDTIESADGWTNDGGGGGYYNLVTATANDGDPDTNKAKTARVALPEITLVADADWSAAYKKSVNAYGPVVGQLTAAAPVAAALEIDASDVYTSGETAGKKSVTPSIATAGWRWEGTDGAEELHNKVTATNPNDSTKKTTVTVDPPTITVDMTASQIRAFASDGTNSYAVATANYTMTGDGLTVSLKNSAGTTVKSVTCADSYLKPENIKEDVTIFGVKGTHVGGGAVTSITQRITPAAYSNDDKEYTVYLRATGTNITAFDAVTIVDASKAYNHGCDSVMPVSATIA